MKKSILFWTVIVCVLYLAAHWLLNLNGLEFRIWIREPVTLLIAAGAFAGIFQLLLRISNKTGKKVSIAIWAAALIAFCIYGTFFFIMAHRDETSSNTDFNGRRCVVEHERVIWDDRELYYAYDGWFTRGKVLLNEE